jgi:phosphoribosylaminoimidazolecarboxamide formyltransferase/IMP cyclohydrolase
MNRVLISVYDKTGIIEFANKLTDLGFEIIASAGTLKILQENGVHNIKSVSDVTHFPEILGGRVKTEHPKLIGAILAVRNNKEHIKVLEKFGIEPINMVVCNFYPLIKAIKKWSDIGKFIEKIDIGGPNIVRAAAKNFDNVITIVNPRRYNGIIKEFMKNGKISAKTRKELAIEAFKTTAKYDSNIYRFLESCKNQDCLL